MPCIHEDEEHIGADQIFPLIKTEYWYTPTIKHPCPRTQTASILSATSNQVAHDPKMYKRFAIWFRTVYIPDFISYVGQELWHVSLSEWLSKYKPSYQDALKKAVDKDHKEAKTSCKYCAFIKVEMQFTTVPHDLKSSIWNDVKERQICGPCAQKKMAANAFINKMEEIASKYCKSYCGRANWIEICLGLEQAESELGDCIWGASDGSGFDKTQVPEMNLLMNELAEATVRHPNFSWDEDFDLNEFLYAIQNSLVLDVSMDHGQIRYKYNGRASGDGWTTFFNTMLMRAYWMFTFYIAGVKNYALKVKGDDVLFALNKSDVSKFTEAVEQVFTKSKERHIHGLGQICKKINYGELTDLDFLSNEFFLTKEGRYRMTRIPARVIQTLSWTTKLPKTKNLKKELDYRKQLCYSKGMCLKAWADGLPIFGVLADKMIELGVNGPLTSIDEYSDAPRVWHQNRDDYDSYLLYLERAYLVTKDEVNEVEAKIKKIKDLSGFIELPNLEKLYHRVC